jgi:hypothetical protein
MHTQLVIGPAWLRYISIDQVVIRYSGLQITHILQMGDRALDDGAGPISVLY